jgi:hypothetical protein
MEIQILSTTICEKGHFAPVKMALQLIDSKQVRELLIVRPAKIAGSVAVAGQQKQWDFPQSFPQVTFPSN